MLFSEPKIPQSFSVVRDALNDVGFSALQRAENSSMLSYPDRYDFNLCFSALQRAENSSTMWRMVIPAGNTTFQCSSASRKFLNQTNGNGRDGGDQCFSALQRAENSSTRNIISSSLSDGVSVHFSEPKIPQEDRINASRRSRGSFSALQRAENSSKKS